MNKNTQHHFDRLIAARDRYKREVKQQKAIIFLLIVISVISASISIYCIYDRVQLTNRIAEQREHIERYKSELAEISRER